MLNVVYGAHDLNLDLDLEALTVAEVQFTCRGILNVSMDCPAYLDGDRVQDKDATVVKHGDRVEFMPDFGQKGVGDVWGDEGLMEKFKMTKEDLQDMIDAGLPHWPLRNGERRFIEDTLDPFFLSHCSGEKPQLQPITGRRRSADKRVLVNDQMAATLPMHPESEGWTARQWAEHLRCSPSTVAATGMWKALMARRNGLRLERIARSMEAQGRREVPGQHRKRPHRLDD
jgi:hypothetical protein